MRPKRPDSAKTQFTKQTFDSDESKQELNHSKFSQTFSSGVNSFHDKSDQFKQYVAEKDKDPKFKHLKGKLEVIEEQQPKTEQPKPSYKPFERKKDKTKQKATKKVQQPPQKPQQQLNLSRGFAEKNKKKMQSLIMSNSKPQEEKPNQALKSKINFDAFKINKPQAKKEVKKESLKKEQVKNGKQNQRTASTSLKKQEKKEEKQEKAKEKTKEQQREDELKSLERYVSEIQARNMEVFPSQYDRMVSASPANLEDLQKIDLNNFLEEPTEEDYELVKLKIQQFDRQLQNGKEQESIDLQQIISGSESPQKTQEQDSESCLQSMSASDLKKRNAFITEILSGKISKKQLDQLSQMDRSAVRMHKLQHQKEEDEQIELPQINMMKIKNNRLLERNRLEAAGHLYRDCDYLSEEHKQRLEQLLQGNFGESPFECDELETIRRRNIDEGIRMYRELNDAEEFNDILNEQSLPKDPQLRRQAEKKVLKEKIKNVNERLAEVDKVAITKQKIKALITKYEHTRPSSSCQELCEQNKRNYEESIQKLKEAEELLHQMEEKENLNEILNDIEAQYLQLQEEIIRISAIDEEELKRRQKQRLKRKLQQVQELGKHSQELQKQIQSFSKMKEEVEESLKIYDGLQIVQLPEMHCEGYSQHQTLEDIDSIITSKWEAAKESEPDTQS